MFRSNRPYPPRAQRPLRTFDAGPVAPISAARLAAEALFAEAPQPATADEPPPVVVIKRRRPVSALAESAQGRAVPADDPSQRRARVFTLRPALPAPEPAPAPDESAQPAPEEAGRPKRRTRGQRIGHDTRAGVIRHLTLSVAGQGLGALGLPLGDGDAATPPHGELALGPSVHGSGPQPLPAQEAAELTQRLAALDGIFKDIQDARAFTPRDAQTEADWVRVSRELDALTRELRDC